MNLKGLLGSLSTGLYKSHFEDFPSGLGAKAKAFDSRGLWWGMSLTVSVGQRGRYVVGFLNLIKGENK